MIINSNPNFNLLYSNYSQSIKEPLALFNTFGVSQKLIDFLYGSNLDVCAYYYSLFSFYFLYKFNSLN